MIRNVVVGRLREGASPSAVEEGLQALRDLSVEGIAHLDVIAGMDLGLRNGNADFVVTVDLLDEEAYERYDADPEHNRIRRDVFGPLCVSIERAQIRLPT